MPEDDAQNHFLTNSWYLKTLENQILVKHDAERQESFDADVLVAGRKLMKGDEKGMPAGLISFKSNESQSQVDSPRVPVIIREGPDFSQKQGGFISFWC